MKKLLSLLIFIVTADSFAMEMACRISNMKPGVDSSNEKRVNFDNTAGGQGSVALINNKEKLLFACGLFEIIYGEK